MKSFYSVLIVIFSLFLMTPSWAEETGVRHVIIISFDGLRPDAITTLGPKRVPHFYDLMKHGAYTFNARTDPDWTITMPNHTSMLTGRGVEGQAGHNYSDNKSSERSIHENKGSYVASIFDVAKEANLTTGLFASKPKFQVFVNSYGKSDGGKVTSKLDSVFIADYADEQTLEFFIQKAAQGLPNLTFIHFAGTDKAGHRYGWDLKEGSKYLKAVKDQDIYLGKILKAVRNNSTLAQSTVIMITADHGGIYLDHDEKDRFENYRVPVIIWGKGVALGADLYKMNADIRQEPKQRQVSFAAKMQPIRNGDVANCALKLLGLPVVPGSTIGNPDPIRVDVPK